MGVLYRAPTQANGAPVGLLIWTVSYEFSGQRAPNVAQPQPNATVQQILQPQSSLTELSEQEARGLRALLIAKGDPG